MSTAVWMIAIALGAAPAGAGEHLLAGATAFRDGRFEEAVVEFRVAERLGAEEARGYAGAALVELGRPEEAIEAFGSDPAALADEDALLSYYRALALHRAGLLLTADAVLATLGDRSGPRIGAEVQRLRASIAAALGPVPATASVDAALARGHALGPARAPLAAAWFGEAAARARRRPDRHRLEEALRAQGALAPLATRRAP